MLPIAIYNQLFPNPLIKFLHQFDGVNLDPPSATDETGHALTVGSHAIVTTSPTPISGTAMLSSDAISFAGLVQSFDAAFNVAGTVEFCLETYIVVPAWDAGNWTFFGIDGGGVKVVATVVGHGGASVDYNFRLTIDEGAGGATAEFGLNADSAVVRTGATTTIHVMINRVGDTIRLFVDGAQEASIALVESVLIGNAGTPIFYASAPDRVGDITTLHIDSTRATIGSNVYGASTYTPDSAPLTLQLP